MSWSDFHCHSNFCDGEGDPASYAEAALERDFSALGFSSHAPLPFAAPWCMGRGKEPGALGVYRRAIAELAEAYARELPVFAGLEVDFIPGLIGPADPAFAAFDYRIGAVHFVGTLPDGSPWLMDENPQSFARGLEEVFGGNARALVRAYYLRLSAMVLGGGFELLAHLDLVKKFNRDGCYFREDEAWYRDLVERSLAIIASTGVTVEVDTGGMARGFTAETYPSPWIIARCIQLGIPLSLNSDAHRPADIDFAFADAVLDLAWAGAEELAVLGEGGWRLEPFDCRGPRRRRRAA